VLIEAFATFRNTYIINNTNNHQFNTECLYIVSSAINDYHKLSPRTIMTTTINTALLALSNCMTRLLLIFIRLTKSYANLIIFRVFKKLENLAVYCCASEEGGGGEVLADATPQNPQPCKILWRSVEKCQRYPRSKIFAPPKSGPKFTKNFKGMLPPKTTHHAKFHRDRSNQLGDKGWSEKKISTHRLTHTRHPDWLSRVSQHARGATKNYNLQRIIRHLSMLLNLL